MQYSSRSGGILKGTIIVTKQLSPLTRGGLWFKLGLLAAALSAAGMPVTVLAQAPAAVSAAPAEIPADDLEKLVGPIALYPDDLVAIILPASTNPLQIVQADRFLDSRKANPKAAIDDKWDDAVKSLVNYPDVIKKMSADLDWTAALGEAVVADQGEVLEAVQAFRRKTQAAGNLKSDSRQVVVVEKEVIKIVPADPQVVYVPQYDYNAVVVTGYSSWGYWPTAYPSYYYPYPPGAALATGLIWGAAIGAAWSGGRYVNHYGGGGNNNINIDRNVNRINTGNINTGNINRGGGASGGSQWKSNKQPGQVSSSAGVNRAARTGDARASGGGGGSAGARPATGGGAGGGQAFQGYGSGRQTQMDSSRGASSRGGAGVSDRSAGGGGARASGGGGGGGARMSGGGGGGARAGGGGGRGGGGGGRR